MTNKESVERNIGLTFDFVNYLIDNNKEIDNLPDNFNLEFIEKDFSKIEQQKNEHKSSQNLQNKYVKVRNAFEFA